MSTLQQNRSDADRDVLRSDRMSGDVGIGEPTIDVPEPARFDVSNHFRQAAATDHVQLQNSLEGSRDYGRLLRPSNGERERRMNLLSKFSPLGMLVRAQNSVQAKLERVHSGSGERTILVLGSLAALAATFIAVRSGADLSNFTDAIPSPDDIFGSGDVVTLDDLSADGSYSDSTTAGSPESPQVSKVPAETPTNTLEASPEPLLPEVVEPERGIEIGTAATYDPTAVETNFGGWLGDGYRVQSGDSIWDLSEQFLRDGGNANPSNGEIDTVTDRIRADFAARGVVGADGLLNEGDVISNRAK